MSKYSKKGDVMKKIIILLLVLLSFVSVASATSTYGIVKIVTWNWDICSQEFSHYLEDPCDASIVVRLLSDTINLNGYLNQYVGLDGADVGVECRIINVQNINILPAPPCCTTWSDVISMYSTYVAGQATWNDVIACYQQYGSSQYTISGIVYDSASVLMELSGPVSMTTTTGDDGSYSFTGLSNGTYTITPSKSACPECGIFFSPGSQTVTINEASISGVDFSEECVACVIWGESGCLPCMFSCYLDGVCSMEEYEKCLNSPYVCLSSY